MKKFESKNEEYRHRLHSAIPGGAHTYSRADDQFPSNAPAILERGHGAYVWDPSGNKYLDYGMALRSVTLGYADRRITDAAMVAISNGNGFTRASTLELRAAETLIELFPFVEMVKFAKNGSNVTTAAAKIARAYTCRKYICVPSEQPFFSFDDWFIGTTNMSRGVLKETSDYTLRFNYNDIESLNQLFKKYPDQIACVIMEPSTHIIPDSCVKCNFSWPKNTCGQCIHREKSFPNQVQKLAKENGALFILDEMITGFRWDIRGASNFFGLDPDLVTYGKAMSNGFSLAALGGKSEYMSIAATNISNTERTFLLSSTHGAEMSALAAFLAVKEVLEAEEVIQHLWSNGERLRNGLNQIATDLGIADYFCVEGPGVALNYSVKDKNMDNCQTLRTLYMQEMIKNGVLMPWISISKAHKQNELDQTFDAVLNSLKVVTNALNDDATRFLNGPAVKPVFRKFN